MLRDGARTGRCRAAALGVALALGAACAGSGDDAVVQGSTDDPVSSTTTTSAPDEHEGSVRANALALTGPDRARVLAAVEPHGGVIAEERRVAGAAVYVVVFDGAEDLDALVGIRDALDGEPDLTAELLPRATTDAVP